MVVLEVAVVVVLMVMSEEEGDRRAAMMLMMKTGGVEGRRGGIGDCVDGDDGDVDRVKWRRGKGR